MRWIPLLALLYSSSFLDFADTVKLNNFDHRRISGVHCDVDFMPVPIHIPNKQLHQQMIMSNLGRSALSGKVHQKSDFALLFMVGRKCIGCFPQYLRAMINLEPFKIANGVIPEIVGMLTACMQHAGYRAIDEFYMVLIH
ncbi:hypothetical protein D3C72_1905480 [compost metagenome]